MVSATMLLDEDDADFVPLIECVADRVKKFLPRFRAANPLVLRVLGSERTVTFEPGHEFVVDKVFFSVTKGYLHLATPGSDVAKMFFSMDFNEACVGLGPLAAGYAGFREFSRAAFHEKHKRNPGSSKGRRRRTPASPLPEPPRMVKEESLEETLAWTDEHYTPGFGAW